MATSILLISLDVQISFGFEKKIHFMFNSSKKSCKFDRPSLSNVLKIDSIEWFYTILNWNKDIFYFN